VEDPVGQEAHLGVAALLAGVGAQGVGQPDHVPQGLKRGAEQGQGAGAAPDEVRSQRDEHARLAERADDVMLSGCRAEWNPHRRILRRLPVRRRNAPLRLRPPRKEESPLSCAKRPRRSMEGAVICTRRLTAPSRTSAVTRIISVFPFPSLLLSGYRSAQPRPAPEASNGNGTGRSGGAASSESRI
jgi:hypothetical protein